MHNNNNNNRNIIKDILTSILQKAIVMYSKTIRNTNLEDPYSFILQNNKFIENIDNSAISAVIEALLYSVVTSMRQKYSNTTRYATNNEMEYYLQQRKQLQELFSPSEIYTNRDCSIQKNSIVIIPETYFTSFDFRKNLNDSVAIFLINCINKLSDYNISIYDTKQACTDMIIALKTVIARISPTSLEPSLWFDSNNVKYTIDNNTIRNIDTNSSIKFSTSVIVRCNTDLSIIGFSVHSETTADQKCMIFDKIRASVENNCNSRGHVLLRTAPKDISKLYGGILSIRDVKYFNIIKL